MILSIFAVISMHCWLAIEPESILMGGSRNTSHPFVSCTVRWLMIWVNLNKETLTFFFCRHVIAMQKVKLCTHDIMSNRPVFHIQFLFVAIALLVMMTVETGKMRRRHLRPAQAWRFTFHNFYFPINFPFCAAMEQRKIGK